MAGWLKTSRSSLVVLDGATGEKRAEPAACRYITPIAVDADHYFGIGLPGSESVEIASFSAH